jgi:hypothetical protein
MWVAIFGLEFGFTRRFTLFVTCPRGKINDKPCPPFQFTIHAFLKRWDEGRPILLSFAIRKKVRWIERKACPPM